MNRKYPFDEILAVLWSDPYPPLFWTYDSGSGIEKKFGTGIIIPVPISEGLETIFVLKILKFFVADPDPGSGPF
jgi:hypothetical protein